MCTTGIGAIELLRCMCIQICRLDQYDYAIYIYIYTHVICVYAHSCLCVFNFAI